MTKAGPVKLAMLLSCLYGIMLASGTASPARAESAARPPRGLGFLLTRETERIIPMLTAESDFLEVVLGPGKIGWVKSFPPPARTMCISMSLAGLAETIALLREAGIEPERIYLAYNPERRAPRQTPVTPDEELADLAGAVAKARALAADYGAPLVAGPGLSQMETQEELYPVLARLCDIWMIQTQRLQAAASVPPWARDRGDHR